MAGFTQPTHQVIFPQNGSLVGSWRLWHEGRSTRLSNSLVSLQSRCTSDGGAAKLVANASEIEH